MIRKLRSLAACLTVVGLVVAYGAYAAPPQDKGDKAKGHGKAKQAQHVSGKSELGDKLKTNGSHKLKNHGKFSPAVDTAGGKIKGMRVQHAEKGEVPVTKYKTDKKMALGPKPMQFFSVAYAQDVYLDTIWIGYAFVDDFGFEVIYWYPIDLIYDRDTGAIWYVPAY